MKTFALIAGALGVGALSTEFIDPRSELGKKWDSVMWSLTGTIITEEKNEKIHPRELVYYQFTQGKDIEQVKAKFDVLDDEKNIGVVFIGCNKLSEYDFQVLSKYVDGDHNRLTFTRTTMHYDGPIATKKYPNYQNYAIVVFNKNDTQSFTYNLSIWKKIWDDKTVLKKKIFTSRE